MVALEWGWIVTEVGRQPWIVNGFMRTSEAVTPAQGIWWVFGFTMVLYIALGTTAVRRSARPVPAGAGKEGGRASLQPAARLRPHGGLGMSTADVCAVILWVGVTLYAIFGGADFGAGVWDLLAGSGERADACAARSTARSARSGRPTTSG